MFQSYNKGKESFKQILKKKFKVEQFSQLWFRCEKRNFKTCITPCISSLFRKMQAKLKWSAKAIDALKTCYGKGKRSNSWKYESKWRTAVTRWCNVKFWAILELKTFTHLKNLLSLPPPKKSPPPTKFLFPPPKVHFPHTNKQFSCYNPIKSSFPVVVIAPAPCLFYLHTLCTHRPY